MFTSLYLLLQGASPLGVPQGSPDGSPMRARPEAVQQVDQTIQVRHSYAGASNLFLGIISIP